MKIAELKVDLMQFITAIDDKKTLRKMMKACKKVAKKNDWWHEVPKAHRKRIKKSYKESFNPDNWVDHEDVVKMSRQWLSKKP